MALYLAAHVKTNVRELEGALLRLAARASFNGQAISLELARDALAKLIANAPDGPHASRRSSARWPAYFDVKLHDLKGPKRHRAIAHPRMVAMYLARKLTNMSYPGDRQPLRRQGSLDRHQRRAQDRAPVRRGSDRASSVVGTLEGHLRQP